MGAATGLLGGFLGASLFSYLATTPKQAAATFDHAEASTSLSSLREDILSELSIVSEEDLITSTVESASPAVVSIMASQEVPVLERYYETTPDPFAQFFGDSGLRYSVPRLRDSGETEEREIGGGSGFLVSEDGYIITNRHVVSKEDASYTVFLQDGTEYEATVIARDPLHDLAVLDIEGDSFPYLNFADSDALQVGQTAIAIGNPLLEFENSVAVGVVSGLSRTITAGSRFLGDQERLEGVIQTDAAINPGNSGGPLLNLSGEVIGVNVAIANGQNIGFSIPSNAVAQVVTSIKETGAIQRPYLGVRYIQITPGLQEKNSLDVDYGALILRGATMEDLAVIPGSPADKAGLVENDIILEVEGERVDQDTSLARLISSRTIGENISLRVLSKGEEREIVVTLEARPTEHTP